MIPIPSKANTAVPMKLIHVVLFINGFPPELVSINPKPFLMLFPPRTNANTRIETKPTKMQMSAAKWNLFQTLIVLTQTSGVKNKNSAIPKYHEFSFALISSY